MAALLTGYAETGIATANVKFVRRRKSDGAFWSGAAFETYNPANIAAYGLVGAETGATGIYTVTDPAETIEGDFLLVKSAGASLAALDLTTGLRWQDLAGPRAAALAANGLDNISTTPPVGVAVTFREMLVQVWRRFFKRSVNDKAGLTIKTYRDDGTSVQTTQAYATSAAADDVGAAT